MHFFFVDQVQVLRINLCVSGCVSWEQNNCGLVMNGERWSLCNSRRLCGGLISLFFPGAHATLIKVITIPVSDTSVQLGGEIKVIPGNRLRWGTTTITANANRFVVGLMFKYSGSLLHK